MAGLQAVGAKIARDWRSLFLFVALSWGWQIVLLALSGRLAPGLIAFFAWLPLLLSLPWAVWASVRMLQRTTARADEFKSKVWVALKEVSGNLGVILVQVLTLSVFVAIGALLLFRSTLGMAGLVDILPIPSVEWFLGFFARFYVLGLVLTLLLAAVTHLAYLFGRLVDSYQWLLSLWVYAIVGWVGLRLVPMLGDGFAWLPNFSFEELYVVGGVYEFRTFLVESGPLAALVLFGVIVVLAAASVLSGVSSDESSDWGSSSEGSVS